MNEVRTSNTVTAAAAARPTSSPGAVEAKNVEGGKVLPPAQDDSAGDVQETSQQQPTENVQKAVAQINDYVQSIQRDLQFSVDEDLEKTVVKVLDRDSGELIRQIPEEVFLELARKLNEDGELRLVNALG